MSNISSLSSRYFSKLKSNFIMLFSNMIMAFLVPKSLGPVMYGVFDFVTEFFFNVLNFLQLGTQNAFYTKYSKNQSDNKIIIYYIKFVFITIVFSFIVVFLLYAFSLQNFFWPGINTKYVLMGLIFSIFTLIIADLKLLNDAAGLTVKSEKILVYQKSFGAIIILILYYFFVIDIETFFIYHYSIMIFLMFGWLSLIKNSIDPFNEKINKEDIKNYSLRFYNYSRPLFIYSVITLICDIGDRLILQFFSGSIEQGYFGFAYRISGICFIFTSAMTPLLLREFSIAFKQKNIEDIAKLFRNNIPLLYFIGAYFCLFFVFNSRSIIEIIGGSEYMLGYTTFVIMCFYPIQQSYGQLSTSLYYATNQTELYKNIAVSVSILGLFTTFILIGSESYGGFNLGSTGLAIKKISNQFIGVTVGLYFNMKFLNLSFTKYMGHKFLVVIILSFLSFLSQLLISNLISNIYLIILLSGMMYTLFVLILIYIYPRIIARNKRDIEQALLSFKSFIFNNND